jgi:hypothetical protein
MTAENTADPAAPDTIVLIHGLWVTPRSWEHWLEHYENKGYRVLALAYPGFEVEVEAVNSATSPLQSSTKFVARNQLRATARIAPLGNALPLH